MELSYKFGMFWQNTRIGFFLYGTVVWKYTYSLTFSLRCWRFVSKFTVTFYRRNFKVFSVWFFFWISFIRHNFLCWFILDIHFVGEVETTLAYIHPPCFLCIKIVVSRSFLCVCTFSINFHILMANRSKRSLFPKRNNFRTQRNKRLR